MSNPPVSMKWADVERERKRMRDEHDALFGDDNFSWKPRGLERAYKLPCDRNVGLLVAYVYPKGPTITVYFWEAGRIGGPREIKDVVDELRSDQLTALIALKRQVELWVEGQIDYLPPSTHE